MNWLPWTKKKTPPAIPAYVAPTPVVAEPVAPMEVLEHDTSQMTMTGVHKAWKRMSYPP